MTHGRKMHKPKVICFTATPATISCCCYTFLNARQEILYRIRGGGGGSSYMSHKLIQMHNFGLLYVKGGKNDSF